MKRNLFSLATLAFVYAMVFTLPAAHATGYGGGYTNQGPKGDKGDKGEKGDKGDRGATGATGATGAQGPKGDTGATGATGAAGKDGKNGVDGKNGTNGTNGTNGRDGKDGAAGAVGATGAAGTNGTNGNDGAAGATGAQGVQGIQGIQGENAPDAVTVQEMTNTVAAAQAQTAGQINSLRDEIHGVAKSAYGGVAAALALQMPALNPKSPESLTMRLGAGAYKGQSAVGISFRKGNKAGDWSMTGGISRTSSGDTGVAIGVEHSF